MLSLDEYSNDFFEVLTSLNNLGIEYHRLFSPAYINSNFKFFKYIEKSKVFLLETDFLEKLFNLIEGNLENAELLRQIGLFIVSLLVTGKINVFFIA